jgi:hypothetical protein
MKCQAKHIGQDPRLHRTFIGECERRDACWVSSKAELRSRRPTTISIDRFEKLVDPLPHVSNFAGLMPISPENA